MPLNIRIDENKKEPIYRQIAESIEAAIKSRRLDAGCKLPTVRELADELKVSRGTAKHAYEYLAHEGYIDMIQGSGTFVAGDDGETASRKEKAMEAMDNMFAELEALGFTPREMEIYLNLKLRGLEEKYDVVKVAVVDCNPETLNLIQQQLSQIGYAETVVFDLGRMDEIADKLNDEYDLVLTTATHYSQVERFMRGNKFLGMMSTMPTTRTVIRLAKLTDDKRVGIVCVSDVFSKIVRDNCRGMGDWSEHLTTQLFGNNDKLKMFLAGKDAVILPEGYMTFANRQEISTLGGFEKNGGEIITYDYKIDKGSFLYIEEQIKKCMNRKRHI